MFHVSKILISSPSNRQVSLFVGLYMGFSGSSASEDVGEETGPPNLGCVFSSYRKGRQEISAFHHSAVSRSQIERSCVVNAK